MAVYMEQASGNSYTAQEQREQTSAEASILSQTSLSLGSSVLRNIAENALFSGTLPGTEIFTTASVDFSDNSLAAVYMPYDPKHFVELQEQQKSLALEASAAAAAAVNPEPSLPVASASSAMNPAGESSVTYGANTEAMAKSEANFAAATGLASPGKIPE